MKPTQKEIDAAWAPANQIIETARQTTHEFMDHTMNITRRCAECGLPESDKIHTL